MPTIEVLVDGVNILDGLRKPEIAEVQAALDALKLTRDAGSKDAITAIVERAMLSDPRFARLSWRQYTPYFNDGEACVFWGPTSYDVEYDGEEFEDIDLDADGVGDYEKTESGGYARLPHPNDARILACLALLKPLSDFDADVFKAAFGDHVECTATAEDGVFYGITTDECDHD